MTESEGDRLFREGLEYQERRVKLILSLNPVYLLAQSDAELYERIERFGRTERAYNFVRARRREYLGNLRTIQEEEGAAFRKAHDGWTKTDGYRRWLEIQDRGERAAEARLGKQQDYGNGHVTFYDELGEPIGETPP